MIAEILATGDEIRSGALVDSNSAYLAEKLGEIGVEVVRHSSVGDDLVTIISILKEVSSRCDIAVCTGGLGPTTDDRTAEAAARVAGVELLLDPVVLRDIEAFFESRTRTMSESNKKQAMFPEGSERLDNPLGTAPGFMLKIDRCHFFFMPGVPHEMEKMLADHVLPRIRKIRGDERTFFLVRTLSTFGLPESVTGEQVEEITKEFPEINLGLRSKFPEIQVKLYIHGENEDHLNQVLDDATEWVVQRIGRNVFSKEGKSMEAVVGDILREQKATLAIAESCTGGLISDWITNVPGSSDYFLFSGIAYSNKSKINVLGVSPDTIKIYGAVHEETAKEMAAGVRRVAGATYGVATSGIAGPTGGTDERPVGTVCIGVATPNGAEGRRYYLPFGSRLMNKRMFATTALNFLRRRILQAEQGG